MTDVPKNSCSSCSHCKTQSNCMSESDANHSDLIQESNGLNIKDLSNKISALRVDGAGGALSQSKPGTSSSSVAPCGTEALASVLQPAQNNLELKKALEILALAGNKTSAARTSEEALKKHYQFWETQPVPKFDEVIQQNGPIEENKPMSEIRQEAYTLPQGFQWDVLNIDDDGQLQELYVLLNENYVEDEDNMFRFDYSPEFLRWALKPPGWQAQWHLGVRVIKSGKLLGFISAIPCTIRIYDQIQKVVEINFLCGHKKLRGKRIAPVLIREITRRVNRTGIFQAVYTAGVVLPKPVSTCRYWHRSLNPKKLIEVKFSHLGKNMTMQRTLKLYKLPSEPKAGLRVLTQADVPDAYRLLVTYLKKFDLAPEFSVEEFKHWFLPRLDVIDSYVVEKDGVVVDFLSFYTLPSTVMHHPTYKSLKAAYAFYNVVTSGSWTDLISDLLTIAKNNGYDVFNALDLMENKEFLEPLKFGIGDGNLQYYLYNWRCPDMSPNKVILFKQWMERMSTTEDFNIWNPRGCGFFSAINHFNFSFFKFKTSFRL